MKRSALTRHAENRSSGRVWRLLVAGSSSRRAAARTVSCRRRPAAAFGASPGNQRLQRRGAGEIFGLDDLERPQRDRRGQGETAGDVALQLAIGRVEIGAARDRAPLAQGGVAEFRLRPAPAEPTASAPDSAAPADRQIGREFGELVFDLELHRAARNAAPSSRPPIIGSTRSPIRPPRRSATPGYSCANSPPARAGARVRDCRIRGIRGSSPTADRS